MRIVATPPTQSISVPQALGSVGRLLGLGLRADTAKNDKRRVLIAWSGGPDSAALLGLCELLQHRLKLEIVVGHVDHGLRPASSAEAALVSQTCRARGYEVRVTRLDVARGAGLSARARAARRAALLAQGRSVDAAAILLGHTATDQFETMMLHLCRGTGLAGVAGMATSDPSAEDPERTWVRPLLELTREQTRALAMTFGIPFVDDPTNVDPTHPRIVLRQQVLPALRQINPRVVEHFVATARRAAEAESALAQQLRATMASLTTQPGHLDARALRQQPMALRMGVLHQLCLDAGLGADEVCERTLSDVDRALQRGLGRRRWMLAGTRVLHLRDGSLWIEGTRR